jgi:hypothetical protein
MTGLRRRMYFLAKAKPPCNMHGEESSRLAEGKLIYPVVTTLIIAASSRWTRRPDSETESR